ncbi:hypothetical protein AFE_2382 [Acidithiobacillus ferrooxidans ATCC 23270]|uniref:Uncharacterized protein n=1 Tax=Acidithiobacillus ferrooxidans (strain ATCC 23270 / DSM 14882 / CIP 104768 / NCIMB 8455) TaxID=243159 RepID=B7J6E6_ACIF2|nr:hypothetical protein AFE_2382 [Acidithiobacillus ferrooxidans ATCC 23270]
MLADHRLYRCRNGLLRVFFFFTHKVSPHCLGKPNPIRWIMSFQQR